MKLTSNQQNVIAGVVAAAFLLLTALGSATAMFVAGALGLLALLIVSRGNREVPLGIKLGSAALAACIAMATVVMISR